MKYVLFFGRLFFSTIFLLTVLNHFSADTISYAAAQGVPLPQIAVPLSGIIAFLGGLSIVFGFHAKIGALFIIIFLIPVTLTMHNFWAITDPMSHMIQKVMFMKNLSMLGGAMIIAYFGSGPCSLDHCQKCDSIPAM